MASLYPVTLSCARDSLEFHRHNKKQTSKRRSLLAKLQNSWHSLYQQPLPRSQRMTIATRDGSRPLIAMDQDVDDKLLGVCRLYDEFAGPGTWGFRKKVGIGSTATVKIMIRKSEKYQKGCRQYAAKIYAHRHTILSKTAYIDLIKSEYIIGKALHHPNIVESISLCRDSGRWIHVMEYCNAGDLFDLFVKDYLQLKDKYCIFKQLLRGVNYLHDCGIAHRDIKLENILVTNKGQVKITDFGMAHVFDTDPLNIRIPYTAHMTSKYAQPGPIGTQCYLSPEVLAENVAHDPTKLDVWSCAIVFCALFLGRPLWEVAETSETDYRLFLRGWKSFLATSLHSQIDGDNYPRCGPLFQEALSASRPRRCILRMLHPDPKARCSIKDALNDRWMQGIECCGVETDEKKQAESGIKYSGKIPNTNMKVRRIHNHLPPPKPAHKKIPKIFRCRFDLGNYEFKE